MLLPGAQCTLTYEIEWDYNRITEWTGKAAALQ